MFVYSTKPPRCRQRRGPMTTCTEIHRKQKKNAMSSWATMPPLQVCQLRISGFDRFDLKSHLDEYHGARRPTVPLSQRCPGPSCHRHALLFTVSTLCSNWRSRWGSGGCCTSVCAVHHISATWPGHNSCLSAYLQQLEKQTGERRLTYFKPCGISVLPKLDVDGIVGGNGAQTPQ